MRAVFRIILASGRSHPDATALPSELATLPVFFNWKAAMSLYGAKQSR
jgi:hypothetical protein